MFFQICWPISEDNIIFPDSEFVFYCALDVLLIPGSWAVFLRSHREREPKPTYLSPCGVVLRRSAAAVSGLQKVKVVLWSVDEIEKYSF